MFPSMKEGDLALFYRLDKEYHSGDAIIIDVDGKKQLRRIVAIAGDEIDITKEGLKINGQLQHGLESAYIFEKTEPYVEGITFPIKVKKGEVFVLGDGREHATDSRIYGAISEKNIKGKLMTIVRRRNF